LPNHKKLKKENINMSIPTPHITAKQGDFAKTVLMPGDPKRAEYIAKNYLTDAKLVNDVRGIKGFTGFYKGKRVSVMASGMGQPSMGIYSYELFAFYGVENIIRVGTCGGFTKDLHVGDIVVGMGACTNGYYASQYNLPGTFCPIASFKLVKKAVEECERKGVNYRVGNVLSSDTFYSDTDSNSAWTKMGVLGVEMEAAALYCNASRLGKNALAILAVSDSFVYPEENATAEERQSSFTSLMEVALEIAE
jgi:purine-nucleoside phosphorylase